MKNFMIAISILMTIVLCAGFSQEDEINENSNIADILFTLGEDHPEHFIEDNNEELIELGRQLIHEGKMQGSRYISKYFQCTSCHNTVREDKNLSIVDPESRLDWAVEKQLPYLQGSTFWGIVNRESWYNDDYIKKYGDLVKPANESLEESIQLCATVCSAGRPLKESEMQAVLAYFWSLQLKLKDLDINQDEREKIISAAQKKAPNREIIQLLKSKYQLKIPATFVDAPQEEPISYGLKGDAERGANIFNLSCKHCHRPHGESDVVFEDSKLTYNWFVKHFNDKGRLSIYNIIRYGTYSEKGHKEYMPHFTAEKMSHQQVEDLRAYIEKKAGR